MRVCPTNHTLLRAYVHAIHQEARNPRDSLSFIGDNLNSYDSPLARINRTDKVLFINHNLVGYSVTTTAHTSALKVICNGQYRIFTIPFSKTPLEVLEFYWDCIEAGISKYLKARTSKEQHKLAIYNLLAEAEAYVEYMQIDRSSPEYLYKTKVFQQLFKHKLLKA